MHNNINSPNCFNSLPSYGMHQSHAYVHAYAGAKQAVELKAREVVHFGACDSATYPMAKKKHGMEFLREKAHLRPRTNVIGAVARIRNQLAYATHNFFQQHGFLYVHTPLITASDCEGAGEMFQVLPLILLLRRPGSALK